MLDRPRGDVLNTEEGTCAVSYVTTNPYILAPPDSKQLEETLLRSMINIAPTQETNIQYGRNYLIIGYRISASETQAETRSRNMGRFIGEVATMIHESATQHITHIRRISPRITRATLHRKESHTPVTISTTCAPHRGKTKKNK